MDISSEILAVASKYLDKVRRSGSHNIMAICPFHLKEDGHPERHPSFAMSLSTGLYFCHACQEKGNLFTFLRTLGMTRDQIEMSFRSLITNASHNLPPPLDPLDPGIVSLNPIPEGLLGLFDHCPLALLNEGFTEETLIKFEIGFDEAHMRITYPLRDINGQLAGISGRAVGGYWPKYKIYDDEYPVWDIPERTGWDKRTILWNAHQVYPETYFRTDPGEIVIVEGFKACMWLVQAGIKNTVALLGTYLSNEQKWVVERMGAIVYLFLDNNEPGWVGTAKSGRRLMKSLPVKVMQYPDRLQLDEDAQPDSLTPEEVLDAKETAIDYIIWLDNNRSYLKSLGAYEEQRNGLR